MSAVATDRIEALLEQVERLPDAAARETALELVQALLDLYGEGLARVAGHVAERDLDGSLAEALAGDELVAHLLLLHGLHPVPLERRVGEALAEVRPYLESHGGNVELLGIDAGVVRLQLQGSCSGCPSSAVTLKLAVEEAIHKAAPDVTEIVAVDAPAPSPLIQLEVYEACPAPLHR
jgi:Fe-S cluster biogenesis protein NfuA